MKSYTLLIATLTGENTYLESLHFSGIISTIFIGLVVGLRHSTDGDHIVAVSTMARDYKSIFKSIWVGISWGLGHSTPLIILGILILLLKQAVLDFYESVAIFFEFGVALMLIFLGLQVFWKIYRKEFHIHSHEHDGSSHKHLHGSHSHSNTTTNTKIDDPHEERRHGLFPELIPFFRVKSYIIGLIHGLAGSAVVIAAILPTTPNFFSGLVFLFFFALGTMVSMALMTVVMSIPLTMSSKSNTISTAMISVAGVLSLTLGLVLGSDLTLGTNFTGILWY